MIPPLKSPSTRSHLFVSSWKLCTSLIHTVTSASEETEVANSKNIENILSGHQQKDLNNAESAYYIENGLRKVYPYYFPFTTYCKGRWVNRSFLDVYCEEFGLHSKEDVEARISSGRVKINGKVTRLDYKLKNSDFITSTVHRHELAVLAAPITILHEDEELLVVDKPPSIPVHPCGLYRYNTIVFILGQLRKWRDLQVAHRLDRLTSGVLLLPKNSKKSREIHREMDDRRVRKEYLCRVKGEFLDGVVTCNKPIRKINARVGVSLVCSQGKECVTEFQKLSFNGKSSVVLCKPLTGRTHQIRVHLQYLGFPILNDPLYNSLAFGPDKGKYGEFHKSVQQVLDDLLVEHSSDWALETSPSKSDLNLANRLPYLKQNNWCEDLKERDEARFTFDENCFHCSRPCRDPNQTHLFMFLHAFKYKGENWEFMTEMPEWATSHWTIM